MKHFIYAADQWCEDCGNAIRDRIISEGKAPSNPDDEASYDSDEFPKGPCEVEDEADFCCGSGTECPNYEPPRDVTMATELATQWELDDVVDAYIEAALWSTHDNANESGGEPLDKNYDRDDLAASTLAIMKDDCQSFLDAHHEDLKRADKDEDLERLGHDFWLTREGHGAGFWDGGWPDKLGHKLTEAAKAYGSFDLYIGDDGKIYAMGYETYESPESEESAD
jgi:hypothetical protein